MPRPTLVKKGSDRLEEMTNVAKNSFFLRGINNNDNNNNNDYNNNNDNNNNNNNSINGDPRLWKKTFSDFSFISLFFLFFLTWRRFNKAPTSQ